MTPTAQQVQWAQYSFGNTTTKMTRFIETGNGTRINEAYASQSVIDAANKGTYKFVNEGDPATPAPKKEEGISLPDKPELPNQGGGSKTDLSIDSLISASKPAVNEEQIRTAADSERKLARGIIESRFGNKINALKEEDVQEERALEGNLGIRRRVSTSGQAFLKYVETENKKEVAALEIQRDEALASADLEFADLVNKRIDQARERGQQEFQNILSILTFAETQEKNKSEREKIAKLDEKERNKFYVSDMIAGGDTDPTSIYKTLREQGKEVSLTDISEMLNTINNVEVSMSGITSEWFAARENEPGMETISLEDYVYLRNPEKGLELKKKRLEVEKLEKDILNNGIDGDPYEMQAFAEQYAATGVKPTGIPDNSFGIIAQHAKEIPRAKGSIVSSITGVVDSKVPATEQQDYSRLYNIAENIKRLKELDAKRWGGLIGGTLGKVFSDDESNAYQMIRKTIIDDMSRMQSGAALTEEEIAFYEDYLPGRLTDTAGMSNILFEDSASKIGNFEEFVNNRLKERLSNNGLVIYGFTKVDIGGKEYTVGDVITNERNQTGRVLPDGSISIDEEDIDETSINEEDLDRVAVQIPQSSRLSFVNNNPGNLRYAGQPGATKGEKGFAKFKSPVAGFKALVAQIKLDARRGLSLAGFINKFAPPNENDTEGYINNISSAIGASRNIPIARLDLGKLAQLIARQESSTNISLS
jgi:hypothetical protein